MASPGNFGLREHESPPPGIIVFLIEFYPQ
jgi:hypothetical protein